MSFGICYRSFQNHFVLFPFLRVDVYVLGNQYLAFAHRTVVDDFYSNLLVLTACPYGETVFGIFLNGYTEETFVFDTGMFVCMTRVFQTCIVRITFKRTVMHQFHITEGNPTHKILWEFKGTVLYHFCIKATICSIVDIFEEETVHGRFDLSSNLIGLHYHLVCVLRIQRHTCRQYKGRHQCFV